MEFSSLGKNDVKSINLKKTDADVIGKIINLSNFFSQNPAYFCQNFIFFTKSSLFLTAFVCGHVSWREEWLIVLLICNILLCVCVCVFVCVHIRRKWWFMCETRTNKYQINVFTITCNIIIVIELVPSTQINIALYIILYKW